MYIIDDTPNRSEMTIQNTPTTAYQHHIHPRCRYLLANGMHVMVFHYLSLGAIRAIATAIQPSRPVQQSPGPSYGRELGAPELKQ